MKPLLKSVNIPAFFTLFLVIFITSAAFSQKNQIDRIKLNWSMYKKLNNSNLPYIAYTAHRTLHQYRATQKGSQFSLVFNVAVSLDGQQSTVDLRRLATLGEEGKKNLLNHEQGHSDLAVIYGRILYKSLSKKTYTIKNYQNEVKKIYDDTLKELAEINARYDMETMHGEEQEPQDKWDMHFKKELKAS
ncbi:DUF922 domain-containing protein [Pedobacter gandavensis]|uniref:DUF922 domain-containing protein n=1 Tax=Pedobacter gandavensis TaxID=2679963 RepID=UPI0024786661|nr:DUF922 domain-containing protein [Pedobacter gandavensis]WGQ10137.1 DUF922 domain-containing protein [Pedobacter gandavensis]